MNTQCYEILEKRISSYDWLKHTKIFKWTVYKSSRIYDRGYVKKMCGKRMDSRLKLVLTQGLTKKKTCTRESTAIITEKHGWKQIIIIKRNRNTNIVVRSKETLCQK